MVIKNTLEFYQEAAVVKKETPRSEERRVG